MDFPFGEAVVRERRQSITDPYNPDRTTLGSWDGTLQTLPLPGVFIDDSSSVSPADATRSQVLTSKSLYSTNPNIDVQAGDRIRHGSEVYYVKVRPSAGRNPWTGWQPVVEIPLEMSEG